MFWVMSACQGKGQKFPRVLHRARLGGTEGFWIWKGKWLSFLNVKNKSIKRINITRYVGCGAWCWVTLDDSGSTDPIPTLLFYVCPAQKSNGHFWGHRWPGTPVCMELEFCSIKPSSLNRRCPEVVENPSTAEGTTRDWESSSVPPWPCLFTVCSCFKSPGEGMLVGMEGAGHELWWTRLNLW